MKAALRIALLLASASPVSLRSRGHKTQAETGLDPFGGALTAPDVPQLLRDRGAL